MKLRKQIQLFFGLALGIFLIWWLFRGTDWSAVGDSIRRAHRGWLLLSIGAVVASFFTRVQRWSYIVRAVEPVSYRKLFSATQIGFLANFTLPLRMGEAIRALVLTRLTQIPFSQGFAMNALDRVTDLFGLIAVMLVAVIMFRPEQDIVLPAEVYNTPIPANIVRQGATGVSLFLTMVLAILVALYVNQRLVFKLSDRCVGMISTRLARQVRRLLEQFAQGLHVFRSPADMAKAIGLSWVTWILFLLTYAALFNAFDLTWSWYMPFVVVSMLSVLISLPGAPGFVGQFHFGVMVGALIVLPSMDVADAKALALLAHLINIIPVYTVGMFCLLWENLGFVELTRAGSRAQAQLDESGEEDEG